MSQEFSSPRADLPGRPESHWLATTDADDLTIGPSATVVDLESDRPVDVAVVGGGIAGLSTAIHCRERDLSVVLLERDRIGSGTTGRSTGKLTSQHGLVYDHLRREFGLEAARRYAAANESAIEEVERRIEALGVDCGFERGPSYLYGDDRDALEREAEAARAAGLDVSLVTSAPPFERAEAAVRLEGQAWFHPRRYLLALAERLREDDGAAVVAGARVTDVEGGTAVDRGSPRVRTANGPTVAADHVVVATGFPILDRAGYVARTHPRRSYVLALRLRRAPPSAIYYRIGDPYRSVRPVAEASGVGDGANDGHLLLVAGENHKTGQGGSAADRYRRLERWARERFPVESVVRRWSAQDYVPADRVPLIGRAGPGLENVSVATGFRGWGLTGGTVAGRLLAARIDGESPPERDLFDPLRFTPKPSFTATVIENADAASQFATDWLRTLVTPTGTATAADLAPGEGTVVRTAGLGDPVACARDADGALHAVSAVCPRDRCILAWNDAEHTWDCPCHGSRFSPTGEVLEGPATGDLPPRPAPRG
ncbi:FAD-dependent oxidoreductase [Natrialbaceae archaeon GCM10025810]|uniref:FAD-dependent oxidoreductase n=1 Tax=Halovalidus salilacus TaxID=3075124 RepID=UPI00360A7B73